MANCIQVLTFDQAQPVSGSTTITIDQVTTGTIALTGTESTDAAAISTAFSTAVPSWGFGGVGATVDYASGTITLEFSGSVADYDWPLMSMDPTSLVYADTTPVVSITPSYSQNGTIPFTTLYWFDGGGRPWETFHWFRDAAHNVLASGWPGSQSGDYSVYITDAPGANTCPIGPVSPVSLALYDTTAVTVTAYVTGGNVNLATSGTMVLGPPGSSFGTTFNGVAGDGCVVTAQGASAFEPSTCGSATITLLDTSYLISVSFSAAATIEWRSTSSNGISNTSFAAGTVVNVYTDLVWSTNTGSGPTINLKVAGVSLDLTDYIGTLVVDDTPVPSAGDLRHGTVVGAVTGTCYVPAASDVRSGVNVDNTTGTYTGGGGVLLVGMDGGFE